MLNKWRKLEEKVIFEGRYKTVIEKQFQLPNGGFYNFEISKGHQSAIVLPFTREGQLIVEKQFRAGPEKVVYELPAGILEDGETPEDGIVRELGEETGYVGDFEFVAEVYPSAYSNAVEYIFVAQNCYLDRKVVFDDGEYVDTLLMPLSEFRDLLKTGQVLNSEAAYLGLDYLGRL